MGYPGHQDRGTHRLGTADMVSIVTGPATPALGSAPIPGHRPPPAANSPASASSPSSPATATTPARGHDRASRPRPLAPPAARTAILDPPRASPRAEALAAQGGLLLHAGQLLGVAHGVQAGDEAVVSAYRQDGVDLAVEPDDQRWEAVDLGRLQRGGGRDPAQPGGEQAAYLFGPGDGHPDGRHDPAAIAQEDDIRREDIEQALQVTRFGRPLERPDRAPARSAAPAPAGAASRDVRPRPVPDLA